MNKILKALMFVSVMVFAMTGCRDDAELVDPGKPGHPEQEMQGSFSGTWTVYNVDTETTNTYTGTLTLEAGDKAYATVVTVVCPEASINMTSPAYIIKQSDGYKFANEMDSNPFGTKFTGEVNKQGVASIAFKKVAREGRKTYVFRYSFEGTK